MRYRLTIAVGIVIAAAAALSAQPAYRLHDNGEIWVARAENCRSGPCVGWHMLDNDPNTREIAAGVVPSGFDSLDGYPKAPPLYQRHEDGTIWLYTGKPCGGGSCLGWKKLDDNGAVSIVAAGEYLYQRRGNDGIWSYNVRLCTSGGSCPGWQKLDDNTSNTAEMTAAGIQGSTVDVSAQTELYQRKDGRIWRYKGTPCNDTSCPEWELLDNNPHTRQLTATVRRSSAGTLIPALYQLRNDGSKVTVWHSKGTTPCKSDTSCPEWELIDSNPLTFPHTISIVTAQWYLYQLRNDGTIWVYNFQPCKGEVCPGWRLLDKNPRTRQIAAGGRSLYKLHDNGAIWRYADGVCSSDESCEPWQFFYDPTMRTIVSTQN